MTGEDDNGSPPAIDSNTPDGWPTRYRIGPTTIRDVAQKAGVSPTTVSHVFSRKRPVALTTRRRVIEAAEELGYAPDSAARRLGSGRSTAIALEIDVSGSSIALNPWYARLLSDLSVAALRHGFTFNLLQSPDDRHIWDSIARDGVAGAVIIDPTNRNESVPRLKAAGIRVVCLGRFPGDVDTTWFDNDYREGMHEAVRHLVDNGCERMVLLSGPERRAVSIDSEAGFKEEVEGQRAWGKIHYVEDLTEDLARKLASQLLGARGRPDAIIGAIDRVAIGAMQAAVAAGLDVPGDVAIVGLGDSVLASQSLPTLTSIRSSPAELSEMAIDFLSEVWRDPATPDRHEFIPAELQIRESSMRR